ncbi:hypothetical protein [Fusobacterium sp.]|uniref:hypothetical protein n=1 Tax=Fusobacterium sp. TaxID=68766 RepID=UPI00396C39F7
MKLKRVYIFIISIIFLIISQLYFADSKPPLLEYKDSNNIVLLTDSRDFHSHEMISATLPNDNPVIINNDIQWKGLPFFISLGIFILQKYLIGKKKLSVDIFHFSGIIFRYPHRVLLN